MYELYPYFTNDGTVGLFSPKDDDIYHSTYGALSESWQKFVLPAHLEQYIQTHDSVKILDICYGIGYNTKAALNVFINEALKNNFKRKNSTSNIDSIAAIHTDNIIDDKNIISEQIFQKKCLDSKNCRAESAISNAAIHTDNISDLNESSLLENGSNISTQISPCDSEHKKILIDAIDSDGILIGISPFIKKGNSNKILKRENYISDEMNLHSNSKYAQINKMKTQKSFTLKKEYKLRTEVQIVLLHKLLTQLNNNTEAIDVETVKEILQDKKYYPYFSKFMLNLAKFYSNHGYKLTCELNNSTFLHNIYYQYISKSYKNARTLLDNGQIDVNYYSQDARNAVKSASNRYNFIFLDAFTPSKCPCLWTLDFFNELYSKLEDDGMILTYSNSAAIRNAFLKSGFFVGKTYNNNLGKFIGTVATKNESLIEHKLNEHDMKLVNSKAGICYRDETLNFDNSTIISNRAEEMAHSDLVSSSQIVKGYKRNEKNAI